jgi:hypothetical protein
MPFAELQSTIDLGDELVLQERSEVGGGGEDDLSLVNLLDDVIDNSVSFADDDELVRVLQEL